MSKLRFKFKLDSNLAGREELIEALAEGGAEVRPVFRSRANEELASIYALECESPERIEHLKDMLQASADIEYVEAEIQRRLIRPKTGKSPN